MNNHLLANTQVLEDVISDEIRTAVDRVLRSVFGTLSMALDHGRRNGGGATRRLQSWMRDQELDLVNEAIGQGIVIAALVLEARAQALTAEDYYVAEDPKPIEPAGRNGTQKASPVASPSPVRASVPPPPVRPAEQVGPQLLGGLEVPRQ